MRPDFNKMELIEKKLKEEEIDYLFYPVDPRLEEYSFLGIKYFIEKIRIRNIIPMHMWDKYEIIKNLKNEIKDINIIEINKNCEEILKI